MENALHAKITVTTQLQLNSAHAALDFMQLEGNAKFVISRRSTMDWIVSAISAISEIGTSATNVMTPAAPAQDLKQTIVCLVQTCHLFFKTDTVQRIHLAIQDFIYKALLNPAVHAKSAQTTASFVMRSLHANNVL